MQQKATDLKRQLLLAALDVSAGDLDKTFTSEQLLVAAWRRDPLSWGLRGFEREYPDSDRIHRELDSRGKGSKGLVDLGFLERIQARVYRLTPKGLAGASELRPHEVKVREKADRTLEGEVRRVLEHPTFVGWLQNPSHPKRFRDAGHFWGIAPGTPPRVIRERIQRVDQTLEAALKVLEHKAVREVEDRRGSLLYDVADIGRCRQFQETLKQRFATDLRMLRGADI